MLISFSEIYNIFKLNNITINGALHIGAHECEEQGFYNSLGINNIVWIDAIQEMVDKNKHKHNIYQAVISDNDESIVKFNITNNIQSSSILEFGTHSKHHPHVHNIGCRYLKTITIDTFIKNNNIDISKLNFWNFDIQGAELLALKGAVNSLKYPTAIYLEVNKEAVYKDCAIIEDIDSFLSKYGFKRVITKFTEFGWGDALYIKTI